VRVRFIGRLDLLPESLVKGMRELEERTADNRQLDLNVAVAYGGRDELLHAARETAREVARGTLSEDEIDEARFARHLYLPEPVDLMVRTGGQRRLSGFLPWQSDYAELYFTDKLWPEFSRADYDDALAYFESVQRNFGR
jgi:undecaprenyl diphosphate synthase